MKYDIVTIGDAFEDVFVRPELNTKYDRSFAGGKGICFEFGEKIPLDDVEYEIGGSACNTAVGFSRLGLKTGIVTLLGDDTPQTRIIDKLQSEDVELSGVLNDSSIKTGFSVIFSINGERTIFVYHATRDYSKLKIKKSIKSRWYFLAPLGDKTDEIEKRLIAEVSENGAKIAWNPGSKQIEKGILAYRHLLRCTEILFLNREEAIKFVGYQVRPKLEEVMKLISLHGPKIVVITDGRDGAKAYDGHTFYEIPANTHVQVIDSTGAGDAFAVGLLARIIEANQKEFTSEIINEALGWGIADSSSVIQSIGAQKGLLTRKEIDL